MKNYKLICMSFDGEYVTEAKNSDVQALWDHSNNMGSKWFFYPFHFVCTDKTIKESYFPVEWLQGKKIKTVKGLFSKLNNELLQQGLDCDPEEFLFNL
jgi:hypothetical protein